MKQVLAVLGLCAGVLATAAASHAAQPQGVSIMADTPLSLAILQRLAPMLERGGQLRVLPVAGKGPVQTVTDLATLHDVDAALVSSDALGYMARNGLVGGLSDKLGFVVKLGGLDVHVVARKGIETVGDLAGKTVVTGRTGGEAFIAGEFLRSAISPEPSLLPGDGLDALRAVAEGKADAAVLVGHRPMPEIASLGAESGLHLIAIAVPKDFADIYAPSLISHDDYPNLVAEDHPVETMSASLTVAVFNWKKGNPQYDKTRALADALFAALAPSPAGDAGLNLAAGVPGWTRYGAAADALAALPHSSQ
jgi:TRAP-type uncharacterized transport system substrate-binding protein